MSTEKKKVSIKKIIDPNIQSVNITKLSESYDLNIQSVNIAKLSESHDPNINKNDNELYNKLIEMKRSILLKLINKILVGVGLKEIINLIDFVDIERDYLIKDICSQIIKDMETELYMFFNKTGASYKKDAKKFVLNCLKSFAKQANIKLCYRKKDVPVTIDGVLYRRIVYVYSFETM